MQKQLVAGTVNYFLRRSLRRRLAEFHVDAEGIVRCSRCWPRRNWRISSQTTSGRGAISLPPSAASRGSLVRHSMTSATVWYEPLFDLDGDRPDLIVLIPDTGVLVIEVLQQKAAAVVSAASGRWTVTEDGEKEGPKGPTEPSPALRRKPRLPSSWCWNRIRNELPVAAIGVFVYIDADTAETKGILSVVHRANCLFRDDPTASTLTSRACGKRSFGHGSPVTPSDLGGRRTCLPSRHSSGHRPNSNEMSLPEIEEEIGLDVSALDRQQESLAKTLGGGHRVICGVAGSGKTLILVHRARLLAQLGARSRILVTCYNKSLQGWLSRQLKPYPNVTVNTLAAQMSRVLGVGGAAAADYDHETDEDVAVRASAVLAELAPASGRSLRPCAG